VAAGALGVTLRPFVEPVDLHLEAVVIELEEQMTLEEARRGV
jgi:hypothetical protein